MRLIFQPFFFISFLFLQFVSTKLSAQNIQYKNYTVNDGLPHNVCYKIMQDSKGFIWIGTDDGLVKFDGKAFKVYNLAKGLPINYAIAIKERPDDSYWVGTWGGGMAILKNDTITQPVFLGDKVNQVGSFTVIGNRLFAWNASYISEGPFNADQYTFKTASPEKG